MMYMLNSVLILFDMIIMVLVSISFLTLLERKILGYIQLRKGPNKVGIIGLLQPFSDAAKLFSKESLLMLKSNYIYYFLSPIFSMLLMLMLWINMPMMSKFMNMDYSLLLIFCMMSLGVYFMLMAGWASNSMYSLIGGLRSVAQTISYEVSMILLILSIIFLVEGFNINKFSNYQYNCWFIISLFPLSMILFTSFLAELNRTPFDFSEGESELVSGFNTEYMSSSFAMIFIAEYGMILFMMFFFMILLMGGFINNLWFYLIFLFMVFMVIWMRGSFPRFRYDNLMYLTWKCYLPLSLNILLWVLGLKEYLSMYLI